MNLGEAAYNVSWYQFSGKEARNLILIIVTSHHPIALTAGKLITLSLQNFTNVSDHFLLYSNYTTINVTQPR